MNKDNPKIQIWEGGVANALAFMAAPPVPFTLGINQPYKNELKGLITLVSNYLNAKAIKTGIGWGKNHLGGYFYESKLNEVRNSLQTALLKTWLDVNADAIANDLTGKAGVQAGDLIAGVVSCKEWVVAVMKGVDDAIYEENRTPYAVNPLGPDL